MSEKCKHKWDEVGIRTNEWDEEFSQFWCRKCGTLEQCWGTDGRVMRRKFLTPSNLKS